MLSFGGFVFRYSDVSGSEHGNFSFRCYQDAAPSGALIPDLRSFSLLGSRSFSQDCCRLKFRPVLDDLSAIIPLSGAQVREQAAWIVSKPVAQRFAGGTHLSHGFVRICFHVILDLYGSKMAP